MARDTDSNYDPDTRGLALLGQLHSFAILERLTTKGLLTKQEAYNLLDNISFTLDEAQLKNPSDESVPVARATLDATLQAFRVAHLPPK